MVANAFPKRKGNSFISEKDWVALIVLGLVGAGMNCVPYINTVSILLQVLLLGGLFFVYRKRPAMMIVAYILLTILPNEAIGGFGEGRETFYSLNSTVCIAFSALFLLYELLHSKRRLRPNLYVVSFAILMICSFGWTISATSYTMDFWWICVAYLLLPLFVKDDMDVRVVLIAYIIAVDLFCISVLPVLVSNADLYRGTVRLNPNYASFFIFVGIAIICTILTHYKDIVSRQLRWSLFVSIALSVVTMTYFASRASFLMLVVVAFVHMLFNRKQAKVMFVLPVGAILLYILYSYGFFDEILLRFASDNTSTGGDRFLIQSALLGAFSRFDVFRLLFGTGYLTPANFGFYMQAHNSYISILIGFGLVGLAIYLAYMYSIYRALTIGPYKSFLVLFIPLCLYAFSIEPYHMFDGLMIFCLLSGISSFRINKTKRYQRYSSEVP